MKGALVKVPVTPFTIAAEQHLVGLFEDVDVLHFSKHIGVPVPRDAVFVGFIDLQFGISKFAVISRARHQDAHTLCLWLISTWWRHLFEFSRRDSQMKGRSNVLSDSLPGIEHYDVGIKRFVDFNSVNADAYYSYPRPLVEVKIVNCRTQRFINRFLGCDQSVLGNLLLRSDRSGVVNFGLVAGCSHLLQLLSHRVHLFTRIMGVGGSDDNQREGSKSLRVLPPVFWLMEGFYFLTGILCVVASYVVFISFDRRPFGLIWGLLRCIAFVIILLCAFHLIHRALSIADGSILGT